MYDIKIKHQKYEDLLVLKDLECQISKGDFVVIMGESGCGKTTFLKIISGILSNYEGEVYFNSLPLHKKSKGSLTKIRGEQLGMIFQDFQLIDFLNVKENIKLINSKSSEEEIDKILEKLNIAELKNKEITKLSGGQKQRVAIARALAGNRKIILADEPTASLDSKTSTEIMEIFKMLNEEGYSIIMITHSPQIASYADKMLYLYEGRFETELELKGLEQSKKLKTIIEVVGKHYENSLAI
ncbi:ABC transporter ATP-binding protein [Alkaliphilus transvaalensis]|uniref:ABC transporter ATP-binding protein n=1 Tax=Alkaliphilus transvaalensis TaxID=114628 RepID=UPI0006858009|nr:ABC transporter ATP-binding protein [Alkaliphilus transvaalensis]